MKIEYVYSLFFLCICGCASSPEEVLPPEKNAIVSFLVTEGAFAGPSKGKEGWVFYKVNEPFTAAPILKGYKFRRGKIERTMLSDSGSSGLISQIWSIGLQPFDWDQELGRARERFQKTLAIGEAYAEPTALDGAEWEIVISTDKGEFRMKKWNPGPLIDFYAPYSDKIGRLKQIIDILALYEGRQSLGI